MKKKKNAKNKAKISKIDQSSGKSESDDEDEDEEDESETQTKTHQNEATNEVTETSPTTDIVPSASDGDIEKRSETIEVEIVSGPSIDKEALQNGE